LCVQCVFCCRRTIPAGATAAHLKNALRAVAPNATCQRGHFAVVSDLPIKRLTQATQNGQSMFAAEQETSPTSSILIRLHPAEAHTRKWITWGKRSPHRYRSRQADGVASWFLCKRVVIAFSLRSECRAIDAELAQSLTWVVIWGSLEVISVYRGSSDRCSSLGCRKRRPWKNAECSTVSQEKDRVSGDRGKLMCGTLSSVIFSDAR
jgi:hypothetical protein